MQNAKRIMAVALVTAALFAGCSKKEESKTALPAGHPETTGPAAQSPHGDMKAEPVIIVPEAIKGKWKAVKIAVLDKTTGKSSEYDVAIGSKVAIPGSDLVIAVDYFFPDFVMDGATRTSRSNEPKNPAAQVRITEKDSEIYKNWLFALLKSPHGFQHPKYEVSLAGYIPAGK